MCVERFHWGGTLGIYEAVRLWVGSVRPTHHLPLLVCCSVRPVTLPQLHSMGVCLTKSDHGEESTATPSNMGTTHTARSSAHTSHSLAHTGPTVESQPETTISRWREANIEEANRALDDARKKHPIVFGCISPVPQDATAIRVCSTQLGEGESVDHGIEFHYAQRREEPALLTWPAPGSPMGIRICNTVNAFSGYTPTATSSADPVPVVRIGVFSSRP